MNQTDVNSYREVREILRLTGEDTRNKIPQEILTFIDKKADDENFLLKYDANGKVIISKNAEAMLVYLYYEYIIADNEQLKRAIDLRIKMNEEVNYKIKKFLAEKVVINDVFAKTEEKKIQECQKEKIAQNNANTEECNLMVKERNIIRRFINKIKSIFRIK